MHWTLKQTQGKQYEDTDVTKILTVDDGQWPYTTIRILRSWIKMYNFQTSLTSVLTLSSHLRLGLPSGRIPARFPIKILLALLFTPVCATWPTHIIVLIAQTAFGEEYQLWNISLCDFLPPPCYFLSVTHKASSAWTYSMFLPILWEAKFHVHTQQQVKLQLRIF
jgi:hypothetical protein